MNGQSLTRESAHLLNKQMLISSLMLVDISQVLSMTWLGSRKKECYNLRQLISPTGNNAMVYGQKLLFMEREGPQRGWLS